MGKLSRTKGKVFEREFATILRERFGDPAKQDKGVRRGIQSRGGGKEVADVACDALPWAHFELSHGKSPSVKGKLEQAESDMAESRAGATVAVAVVKFDRQQPIVAMRLNDWLDLIDNTRDDWTRVPRRPLRREAK